MVDRAVQAQCRAVFSQRLGLRRCAECTRTARAGWKGALPPTAKGLLPPCPAVGHLLGHKQGTDIWAAGRGYSRTELIFAKLLITV